MENRLCIFRGGKLLATIAEYGASTAADLHPGDLSTDGHLWFVYDDQLQPTLLPGPDDPRAVAVKPLLPEDVKENAGWLLTRMLRESRKDPESQRLELGPPRFLADAKRQKHPHDRVDRTKAHIWACSHNDGESAYLVIARTDAEAKRLYTAATGEEPDACFEPEWRLGDEGPHPVDKMLGIWVPKDSVYAGYGLFPDEDWRECPSCGLIKPDSEWSEERDDADECDECASGA